MYHAHNLLVSCVTVVLFLATVLLRHSHALLVYCVTVVLFLATVLLRHSHALLVYCVTVVLFLAPVFTSLPCFVSVLCHCCPISCSSFYVTPMVC